MNLLASTAQPEMTAASRFQGLFEHAPISMQLLAADGRTIQVNRAFESLWNITEENGAKAFILSERYNVLADAQLEAKGITSYIRRAFAGESVKIPVEYYDPAELGTPGRARWVTATAHPVKDASGSVCEVMLMHEDVTEQMESQRRLRENEERFRSLVMATSIMVWTVTPEGMAVEDSASWRAFTGQTMEEWRNDGWLSAVHPEDRERCARVFYESMKSKSVYDTEYRLRRADGQYRWTAAKAVPLLNPDGSVREWIGSNTEITERKLSEDALRESEARFRTITDAMPQMVWTARPDGYHEYYNRQWYEFTGVAAGSTDGEGWDNIVHPEDQPRTWEVWRRSLETGEPYEMHYRLRHHTGGYRWALGRALPVRDGEGKIVRWMGTCTDIDEQKQAEAALQDAGRRKDEFLAMLAHELRNPLAPISAAAELMELAELDLESIRQTSQIINRQVRHMTGLVDDLLDVSRVTRGLIRLDRSRQDLKLIVSNAMEQVVPLVQARRHHLTMDLARDSLYVKGDHKRLVQILTNLLNNAAKYTPEGGNLHLGVEALGDWVRLIVRDDGIGIEPELQPRIFDLFTQADRTSDRAQGGLGIGLALVKSLVELHGGEVACGSEGLGKGSEFIVMLPRMLEYEGMGQPQQPGSLAKSASRLRILLVDDNADAAAMLAMFLEALGHKVLVEHDGGRALECARTETPDVCLLDIGLPGLDGNELARRLKSSLGTADAVLIAITGYGQEQDRTAALAAGFSHHFAKPVDTRKLAAILAEAAAAVSQTQRAAGTGETAPSS